MWFMCQPVIELIPSITVKYNHPLIIVESIFERSCEKPSWAFCCETRAVALLYCISALIELLL